jgi:hypothetical protein
MMDGNASGFVHLGSSNEAAMTVQPEHRSTNTSRCQAGLATLSLADLLARIVEHGDSEALREFHDHRPVFRLADSAPLRFAEFVAQLRVRSRVSGSGFHARALRDEACDLLVDRFLSLPPQGEAARGGRSAGPDCRHYFGSVLSRLADWKREHPDADEIKIELATASILQQRVALNFRRCEKEAARKLNRHESRYLWHVNGGNVEIIMPRSLVASQRRVWLEENVPHPDPNRPGERARVQAIVDGHFRPLRTHSVDVNRDTLRQRRSSTVPTAGGEGSGVYDLATVVADEKAESIQAQRAGIRELGRDRLRDLVRKLFESVIEGTHTNRELAAEFGLHPATLSRFGGRETRRLSDLWVNTATVLAKYPAFVDMAKRADELKRAEKRVRTRPARRSRDA